LSYSAITGGQEAGDTGIEHGKLMIEFAEAILSSDKARLDAARDAILASMGSDAVVDSAAVAGLFNAIDRVADATGAPLETDKAEMTAELREMIGINEFAATKKALEGDKIPSSAQQITR